MRGDRSGRQYVLAWVRDRIDGRPRIPDVTTTAPISPKPRRRWLQFSLRTVMVIVLLLALPLGWIGVLLDRSREQERVLGHFRKYEPVASFRYGYVVTLGFSGNPYVAGLRSVPIEGPNDADMVHLKGFKKLECLSLGASDVTDAGVRDIGELTALKVLSLYDTRISDFGLKHLKKLTNLKVLNVGKTGVTSDGVASLQKALPNCEIRR